MGPEREPAQCDYAVPCGHTRVRLSQAGISCGLAATSGAVYPEDAALTPPTPLRYLRQRGTSGGAPFLTRLCVRGSSSICRVGRRVPGENSER